MGDKRHASAALHPEETRYLLYMEVGGPQGRSGRVGKMSPPMESDPRTVQPVASGYTDCAIPVHTTLMLNAFHVVLVLYFDGSKNRVNSVSSGPQR